MVRVDDDALPATATEVAAVTRSRYPELDVPFHSRWRHFEAGGVDRRADLDVRAMIDLTVVSVLLDAGAGPRWRYAEDASGCRSPGPRAWVWPAGTRSPTACSPRTRAAVARRRRRTACGDTRIARGCLPGHQRQPLSGSRAGPSCCVGSVTHWPPIRRCSAPEGRPGGMFDVLVGPDDVVSAHAILSQLLSSLSGIWLTGNVIGGQPLGDVWPHPAVPGTGPSAGWMPFHKLSQWLTYSLLEPFGWAGVTVTGIDELTGLPEYRNGGLLLDTGVLRLRDPDAAQREWVVDDELVVEWRALTVALLDELAPLVRTELGADVPLACVLEGGTWQAGRATAGRYETACHH